MSTANTPIPGFQRVDARVCVALVTFLENLRASLRLLGVQLRDLETFIEILRSTPVEPMPRPAATKAPKKKSKKKSKKKAKKKR